MGVPFLVSDVATIFLMGCVCLIWRQVAAMGVPFLIADVGGVAELLDLGAFSEAVVAAPAAPDLAAALQTVLERGALPAMRLLPSVRRCFLHAELCSTFTLERRLAECVTPLHSPSGWSCRSQGCAAESGRWEGPS